MTNETPIKFFKLKSGDNLISFVLEENETSFVLKRPIVVEIENDLNSGRQIIDAREWIPPLICTVDQISLSKDRIEFSSEVQDHFKPNYKNAVEFLYSVEPKEKVNNSSNSSINVIPFSGLKH